MFVVVVWCWRGGVCVCVRWRCWRRVVVLVFMCVGGDYVYSHANFIGLNIRLVVVVLLVGCVVRVGRGAGGVC